MNFQSLKKLVGPIELSSISFCLLFMIFNLPAAQESWLVSAVCYLALLFSASWLYEAAGCVLCYKTESGYDNKYDLEHVENVLRDDLSSKEWSLLTAWRVLVGVVVVLGLGIWYGVGYFAMFFASQGLGLLVKTYYDHWKKNNQPLLENARKEFLLAIQDEGAILSGAVFIKGRGSFILKKGYNAAEFDAMLDWLDFDYDQEALEDGFMMIQGFFELQDNYQIQRYWDGEVGECWVVFKYHDLSTITDPLTLSAALLTDNEFVEEFEEYLKRHPEEIGLENETDRTGL